MTQVLNQREILPFSGIGCANINPPTPLNTFRQTSKPNRLSKSDVLKILQDLVLEAPLIDYIVAHGVISPDAAQDLMQEPETDARKIEKLLDIMDADHETPQHYSPDAKLVLLTNALRSTGQHVLASQLDCGRKIKPAPETSTKPGALGIYEDRSDIGKSHLHGLFMLN